MSKHARSSPSLRKHPMSLVQRAAVFSAAGVVFLLLAALLAYILIKGIPHLHPGLFAWKYTSENVSMLPAMINTLTIILLSLALAVPVGIGAAIYLAEYAPKGNLFVRLIRLTAETLAGIPSIVYGLFGFLLFVIACGMKNSILSGALTLAIMVLPIILRTTEEALHAVPDTFREASFGLGAGRVRTVFRVVLPAAASGISSGIILAVGRIVGETAALLYTAGTVTGVADSLMDSGRTLAVHMYCLLSEGLYTNEAYATAVVLLFFVICINGLSGLTAKKLAAKV